MTEQKTNSNNIIIIKSFADKKKKEAGKLKRTYGFWLLVILATLSLIMNLVLVTVALKCITYDEYIYTLQGRFLEFLLQSWS